MTGWEQCELLDADLHLPEASGVYAVRAKGANSASFRRTPLYVGMSANLNLRMLTHNRWMDFMRNDAAGLSFFVTDDHEDLEEALISYWTPELNRKIPTGRPEATYRTLSTPPGRL